MFKKVVGIIMIINLTIFTGYVVGAQNSNLGNSVLRLHVLAHSDNPQDQILKMEVKDEIVTLIQNEFKDIKDIKQANQLAQDRIPQMKEVAEKVIAERGYEYPVEVYVGEYEFPVRSYGNMVFPQGKYQAVRVVIGDGAGKNWWCVLFPPLCLISSSDKGISFDNSKEAEISFKSLELLTKGVKISTENK